MPSQIDSQAEQPASILVILPTWVGDCVMATPFLRALRRRAQRAHITYLLEPNLEDLVRGCPWMDDFSCWPHRSQRMPWHKEFRMLTNQLRRQRFDWAVLLPNSARSALLARLIGAKRRFGYSREGRGFLLTDPIRPANRKHGTFEPMPLVFYYADLAEALGCERPDDRLELCVSDPDESTVEELFERLGSARGGPRVVISPGAKYGAAKCWPPDRFAAAADILIREDGAEVFITCGPGEQPIVEAIRDAMQEEAHALLEPLLSLGQLKSLIRKSDLLICNDAGPRHIGKAFGISVVTIFGPTHPLWTATKYDRERIVRIDVPCGPCQQRLCPLGHLDCMTGVTVPMVVDRARTLLGNGVTAGHS